MLLTIYGRLLLHAVSHDDIKLFNFLCAFRKRHKMYIERELEKISHSDIPDITTEQAKKIYDNIQKQIL